MARRASIVDSLKAHDKSFAVLDLGDFMSNKQIIAEMESRFIWRTMEQLGYLATTPGVRELNEWSLYSDLVSASSIQSISSNLSVVDSDAETPAGLETLVTDIGGVKVGLFALISENVLSTVRVPEGIEYRHKDPVETAKRLVPDLRKKAELVVLMSQLSPKETDDLVEAVPGIDVVLYGRQPSWQDPAELKGGAITQQTGIRGQFLGELVLIVDPDGRIVDWGSRNRPLDEKVGENAELAAEIKKVQDEGKELVKQSRKERTEELDSKLSSERYLGVEKCSRCHEQEHEQWSKTPHAHAWATLVSEDKQADQECISCHVTGYQEPSGFVSLTGSSNLINVQCESCHGVGTMHARGEKAAKVTEEACRTCHSGAWEKGFDFAKALAKVDHTAD